ncbi:MAG: DNA (cytosine-5-)-methyltransferase [Lactobacillus sp.]|nr:MAG: DNA (cytosine-5-)-methyltransferase [Lactobacillus sp.]
MEYKQLTLGSLFDGSGGFPLAGILCGIKPVWSSEIEPFPIRVTEKRLSDVIHFGDIAVLDGGKLPPVDIITFGSPCQDMSLAGTRSGLSGKRSGLFFDAVRVIREMREATDGKYPRYAVWENVTGAFSSNKGEDFRAVLTEFCRIKDGSVTVPSCDKWSHAGLILGDGFSVAWRMLNAMYWGVPQRRKRIFLVADLDGDSAGTVLFESEGLSGYSCEGFEAWQRTANDTLDGSGETGGRVDDALVFENHMTDARYSGPKDVGDTVTARYGTGGNNQPLVLNTPKTMRIRAGCEGGGKGPLVQDDVSATLGTHNDQTLFQPKAYGISPDSSYAMLSENPHAGIYEAETSRMLDSNGGLPSCNQGGTAVVEKDVHYSSSKASHFTSAEKELANTLVATDYKEPPLVNGGNYIVRRLTPIECARLQGFPDWWCGDLGDRDPSDEEIEKWRCIFSEYNRVSGKTSKPKSDKQIRKWLADPYSDSAAYKMWGNGVALPCVWFVLAGIVWADRTKEKADI